MEKSYKNKYRDTKYKQIAIAIKPNDYTIIDGYCKTHNLSKAALITRAVKYCIIHNIDLSADQNGGAAENIGGN